MVLHAPRHVHVKTVELATMAPLVMALVLVQPTSMAQTVNRSATVRTEPPVTMEPLVMEPALACLVSMGPLALKSVTVALAHAMTEPPGMVFALAPMVDMVSTAHRLVTARMVPPAMMGPLATVCVPAVRHSMVHLVAQHALV